MQIAWAEICPIESITSELDITYGKLIKFIADTTYELKIQQESSF
jgi:hypothetical protein